jgi:hypothetical protein
MSLAKDNGYGGACAVVVDYGDLHGILKNRH